MLKIIPAEYGKIYIKRDFPFAFTAEYLIINQEEAVKIEVEDTGYSTPEDSLQRIFDPFFTTKRVGEGTRLGLSVSKNIIELHRGIIEVESLPGKGSKAIVTLKIAEGG